MFDIITIGDTTVDIFLDIDPENDLCTTDREGQWLRLKYGGKIPVRKVHRVFGVGNAANVAVGAARLGLKTAIYTQVGDDETGQNIRARLAAEHISPEYIRSEAGAASNMSVVLDYKGDRTILVHHEERRYRLPVFKKPSWIYFSSISENDSAFYAALAGYVKRRKASLGFNPGSMQLGLGVKKLKPILEAARVIFVNVEEAARLTKKTKDIKQLLNKVKKLGPDIVVITDGTRGSYCYDGHTMLQIGILHLPVVERTGCGDAYASGFISALACGLPVGEAMRWGSANAAHAAMEIGSQAGLLARYQLENLLARHPQFQPQKM